MKRALVLLGALAASLAAAPAGADVISPPPTSCPDGTSPELCHGPPYCAPRTCASDVDCKGAGVCQSASLCVTDINCNGGWSPPDAHALVQSATTVCSGACADGAQCSTLKVCMSSGSASSGSGKASSGGSETFGGCSCDVGGSVAEPGAWPAVLAALAGMARLRRRAGSPHGAAARRHRSA